jgi:hypothetical protein
MTKHVCAMLAASVAALGACKSKNDAQPKDEPKEETKETTPKPTEPKEPAEPPVTVNPEVKQLIADLVANCKIDADYARAEECKNGEDQKFFPFVQDKQPEDYYVSLAEIALTDGATDKNTFGAVLVAIGNTGWGTGKEWLAKNATPAAGKRFIKVIEQLTDSQSFSLSTIGAAIPVLAGMGDELTAALLKHPAKNLRQGIVNYYAFFGGAAMQPTLEKIAKEGPDEDTRAAAVWAAGVALARPWSSAQASFTPGDDDIAKLCDWAKGYVTDPAPRIANSAAGSMGRCKGAYIDAALASLEARAQTEPFDEGLASSLKDMCWAESSMDAVNGTAEQCEQTLAILEKAVARTDLEPHQLRSALWSLSTVGKYGCGPGYGVDPLSPACYARVKEVVGTFKTSTVDGIADEATRILGDLP